VPCTYSGFDRGLAESPDCAIIGRTWNLRKSIGQREPKIIRLRPGKESPTQRREAAKNAKQQRRTIVPVRLPLCTSTSLRLFVEPIPQSAIGTSIFQFVIRNS